MKLKDKAQFRGKGPLQKYGKLVGVEVIDGMYASTDGAVVGGRECGLVTLRYSNGDSEVVPINMLPLPVSWRLDGKEVEADWWNHLNGKPGHHDLTVQIGDFTSKIDLLAFDPAKIVLKTQEENQNMEIKVGDEPIVLLYTEVDGWDIDLTWESERTSSNPKVVRPSECLDQIEALSPGTATITLSCLGHSLNIPVTVVP